MMFLLFLSAFFFYSCSEPDHSPDHSADVSVYFKNSTSDTIHINYYKLLKLSIFGDVGYVHVGYVQDGNNNTFVADVIYFSIISDSTISK